MNEGGVMIQQHDKRKIDESMFKLQVNKTINRILDCMLNSDGETCINCSDVSICNFLTEAVYDYRQQYVGSSLSSN